MTSSGRERDDRGRLARARDRKRRDLGQTMHPHELRYTAASLAIAAGANVKVVQQMLGHKTATMTLDLYGHLFPDQLDDVAERLDLAAADVYPLCTGATVTELPTVHRAAASQ